MPDLIDSHVHIDDARFDVDRASTLERAAAAGVVACIVPAVDAASWPRIDALCAQHRGLHPAWGLHPVYVGRHRPADLSALRSWLARPQTVAVGEIGLDGADPSLDPESQRDYFRQQLELAREFELPVIVHARRALEEVTLTMRQLGGLRGVVHSFSGSVEQARQLWQMGFCLGIGGPVTYPRAQRLRGLVASMPLEHLLLESDAPDQPDVTHRGQRNEPAHIAAVLACIAELRDQPPEQIARASSANARRLFGLQATI